MMDDKTLEALKASIKHWDDNAKAETPEGVSVGSNACALCGLYIKRRCVGCPVAEKTGDVLCFGSPYYAADEALFDWVVGIGDGDTFRAAAAVERDFLISLLPGGTG